MDADSFFVGIEMVVFVCVSVRSETISFHIFIKINQYNTV